MSVRRNVFVCTVIVATLAVSGVAFQTVMERVDYNKHPAPGELIEIGRRNVHLLRSGSASSGPVVVFDSGAFMCAAQWREIQKEVSRSARTISWDRPGLCWSDGADATTSNAIADTLHAALKAAGEEGPFVLVGHSMGALNVRAFAIRHPGEVAGVVLVDGSSDLTDAQWITRFPETTEFMERNSFERARREWLPFRVALMFGLPRFGWPQNPFGKPTSDDEFVSLNNRMFWQTASMYMKEWDNSARQVKGNDQLSDVPLTVITAGKHETVILPSWMTTQKEVTGLSNRSQHIIAEESGHFVTGHQPDLVIGAIVEMLEQMHDEGEQIAEDSMLNASR